MNIASKPRIIKNSMPVKDAAKYSGYSQQYLRRLLRTKKLIGFKVGQLWLIEIDAFALYLSEVENSQDFRFGPKANKYPAERYRGRHGE